MEAVTALSSGVQKQQQKMEVKRKEIEDHGGCHSIVIWGTKAATEDGSQEERDRRPWRLSQHCHLGYKSSNRRWKSRGKRSKTMEAVTALSSGVQKQQQKMEVK